MINVVPYDFLIQVQLFLSEFWLLKTLLAGLISAFCKSLSYCYDAIKLFTAQNIVVRGSEFAIEKTVDDGVQTGVAVAEPQKNRMHDWGDVYRHKRTQGRDYKKRDPTKKYKAWSLSAHMVSH